VLSTRGTDARLENNVASTHLFTKHKTEKAAFPKAKPGKADTPEQNKYTNPTAAQQNTAKRMVCSCPGAA
jgi:hypothetical protein